MPATDSPAVIVARYLKANNYTEVHLSTPAHMPILTSDPKACQTYDSFIREAGLPPGVGIVSKGDLTIETLLEEKKTFDVSVKFEKLGAEDASSGWTKPGMPQIKMMIEILSLLMDEAPSTANEIKVLPSSSNILSAQMEHLAGNESAPEPILLVSTADRRLHLLDARSRGLRTSFSGLHDSPILSVTGLGDGHLLTTSMSGQLQLSDMQGKVLEKRRDHSKYVVKVAALVDASDGPIIATAGWDSKIVLYRPQIDTTGPTVGEPVANIPLATKPEAMIFVRHPEHGKPVLLVSRTDSSFIFYYTVEPEPRLLGKQNLAPHSNAWVAFTPSSFQLCPTDPSLIAVGTSSVPHMKLLVVRLLFPPWEAQAVQPPPGSLRSSLLDEDGPAAETQASQARAALAIADREAAAIQIHCTTMAPQTAYSTPAIAWRPNGSGVWVNGDDGAVRGIEVSTGKVVSTLLQGHEPGSKVRCLWAGIVNDGGEEKEILASGGFDRRLVVWTV